MTDATYAGKTLDEWVASLTDASPATKQRAAEALGAIGATGHARVVDVLLDELSQPAKPAEAKPAASYTTIVHLGEKTEVDTDAAVQVAVINAVSKCGDAASRAVPRLCEMLGRERTRTKPGPMRQMIAVAMGDAAITNAACEALASIGKPAFPNVRELLKSPIANVRAAAARTLGQMGAVARDAVPQLEELAFRDPSEATRTSAQRSLGRLR